MGCGPVHRAKPASLSTPSSTPPAHTNIMLTSSQASATRSKKRKIIFLGAPTLDRVDLQDSELEDLEAVDLRPDSASTSVPKWRVLHIAKQSGKAVSFTIDSAPASEDDVEQEEIQSDAGDESTASSSYLDSTTILSSPGSDAPTQPPIPSAVSLTSVATVPPARLVTAATTRVTLLVGVLSIAPKRTITTRHGHRTTVTTLTVGDATFAPFNIDVWIGLHPRSVDEMRLRAIVQDLRVLDVIVVKNCRLVVYNERVFGTAGHKAVDGSEVWVLHRVKCVDAQERRMWRRTWGDGPAERTAERTVEWVREFGGVPEAEMDEGGQEEMPQDTQTNISF